MWPQTLFMHFSRVNKLLLRQILTGGYFAKIFVWSKVSLLKAGLQQSIILADTFLMVFKVNIRLKINQTQSPQYFFPIINSKKCPITWLHLVIAPVWSWCLPNVWLTGCSFVCPAFRGIVWPVDLRATCHERLMVSTEQLKLTNAFKSNRVQR